MTHSAPRWKTRRVWRPRPFTSACLCWVHSFLKKPSARARLSDWEGVKKSFFIHFRIYISERTWRVAPSLKHGVVTGASPSTATRRFPASTSTKKACCVLLLEQCVGFRDLCLVLTHYPLYIKLNLTKPCAWLIFHTELENEQNYCWCICCPCVSYVCHVGTHFCLWIKQILKKKCNIICCVQNMHT